MEEGSLRPFAAASNSQLTATTLFVSAVLAGTALLFFVLAWRYRERTAVKYVLAATAVLQLVLMAVFANFKIRGYDLSPHQLTIRHGLSRAMFPLQNLVEARIEAHPLSGATRRGGIGGVWSYFGRFQSPRLGEFRAYLSDPRQAVLIRFPDQQVLVSPSEPEAFIAALLKSK